MAPHQGTSRSFDATVAAAALAVAALSAVLAALMARKTQVEDGDYMAL